MQENWDGAVFRSANCIAGTHFLWEADGGNALPNNTEVAHAWSDTWKHIFELWPVLYWRLSTAAVTSWGHTVIKFLYVSATID
jgi:hypothetical protein